MTMPISPKQKIYLMLFLTIILIAGLVFLGVCPLFNKIKLTSVKIQEKQALLLSFDEQENYIIRLQREYSEVKEKIPLISVNFLTRDEPIKFITFLEDIADKTSSRLEINVLDSEPEFLSFQLIVENRFQGLMNFLAYLENTGYYIDVISMNIERFEAKEKNFSKRTIERESASNGEVRATFQIKVYTKQ